MYIAIYIDPYVILQYSAGGKKEKLHRERERFVEAVFTTGVRLPRAPQQSHNGWWWSCFLSSSAKLREPDEWFAAVFDCMFSLKLCFRKDVRCAALCCAVRHGVFRCRRWHQVLHWTPWLFSVPKTGVPATDPNFHGIFSERQAMGCHDPISRLSTDPSDGWLKHHT